MIKNVDKNFLGEGILMPSLWKFELVQLMFWNLILWKLVWQYLAELRMRIICVPVGSTLGYRNLFMDIQAVRDINKGLYLDCIQGGGELEEKEASFLRGKADRRPLHFFLSSATVRIKT